MDVSEKNENKYNSVLCNMNKTSLDEIKLQISYQILSSYFNSNIDKSKIKEQIWETILTECNYLNKNLK